MEEPSHSFNAQSLPGTSFIAFRISLVFLAHSFQTDFVFKSILPHFQKGCLIYLHTLSFSICSKNNSQGEDCLVISAAINIFRMIFDLPCLPGEWVSFSVLGAVELSVGGVSQVWPRVYAPTKKVHVTLGEGQMVMAGNGLVVRP